MKPSVIALIAPAVVPVALTLCVSIAGAQGASAPKTSPRPASGVGVVSGALPGGAVISGAKVTATPVGGGASVSAPISGQGAFALSGLAPGRYRIAVTSAKQTQGATFGEKVNAGLHAAGSAKSPGSAESPSPASSDKAKHDMAKNSVGNIRGRVNPNDMPARMSVNMTIERQRHALEIDGAPVEIDVRADGKLAGTITPN